MEAKRRGLLISVGIVALVASQSCGGASSPPIPSVPSPPSTAAQCGVERWAVKTLTDVDATQVDVLSVSSSSIGALNGLTARCSGLPERRSDARGFRLFHRTGILQGTPHEGARDAHI